jgi:hypothetical protein
MFVTKNNPTFISFLFAFFYHSFNFLCARFLPPTFLMLVTKQACIEIEKLRSKLRRIPKKNIIFMDETYFRLSDAPRSTLVFPGESEYVEVADNSHYAARYDMITFISGDKVFPPVIYSPEDRKALKVDGIRSEMVNDFITDYLARSIAALDRYPLFLLCDKSNAHNLEKMKESFELGLCFEIVDISKLPTQAAKRVSPLDNGIYADWKKRCRSHYPINKKNIEQIMSDEWEKTTPKQIAACYKHCGLTPAHNPYFDCPAPSSHQHFNNKK